ncbi:MAG: HepT-like ribonuclease domain-containing protein [Mycobacteriales bacterium]
MSRRDAVWLADILAAIDAIRDYLAQGSLDQSLIYDACRARLIEIGEAVKSLDPELLATAPAIRWRAIARMRDHLAHHYFDTDHAIVIQVVHEELTPLRAAVVALAERAATQRTATPMSEPAADEPAP